MLYVLGIHQGIFTWHTCLQRQLCLGIQGVIWLSKSSLTQHHQLVVLRRHRLILTWVHISTSHATRLVAEIRCWCYIFFIQINHQRLSIFGDYINMRVNTQAVVQTHVKTPDKRTSEQEHTDGKYIRTYTFK